MTNVKLGAIALASAATLTASLAHADEPAAAPSTLAEALAASKPLFDARIRYEFVDQDGFAEDANALTYRLRLGVETGSFLGTSLLVDIDHVEDIAGDFNSTINGETGYPVVADPDATELNRLQLTNKSLPDTTITLGRQRIILDDSRFVGNVGFRQNEQTFDALRAVNKSVENLTVDVAYVGQVNRIFGDDSPMGRWDSDSWFVNAGYAVPLDGAKLQLSGFAYLLDFDSAPAMSSETFGAAAAFTKGIATVKGSYALQSDYGNQPVDYEADYYFVEGALAQGSLSGGIGYEVLTGDGTRAFSTPLATLHKFNGWADKFLGTPADGLEDFYVRGGWKAGDAGALKGISLTGIWHDFSSENSGADLGSELDLVAGASLGKAKLTVKYADFGAEDFATDTAKFWFQMDYGI